MSGQYRGIEVFGRQPRRRAAPRKPARRSAPVRRSRLGIISVVAGAFTAASTITGIAASLSSHFEAGILLAYLSTGTSVVAVLCGVTAVVSGRGRRWGAVGVLLGVIASPPVLTKLLGWASGLG